ncbi:hypothetical protein HY638_03520 [Candidatus Woesearchaeota archaeon]|nr:hypothetical protein [Candidatus Woesearchaeota archaeon]
MKKFNYCLGASFSSVSLLLLIVVAELFEPFKNLLKSLFSHHWIGKMVVIAAIFLIAGFSLRKGIFGNDERIAWYSVIITLAVIFLFFAVKNG